MSLEARILKQDSRARLLHRWAVGAGFFAAACFLSQALLLSRIVSRVSLGRQSLPEVLPLLAGMLGLIFLRTGLLWTSDVLSQRAASRLKGSLRDQLTRRLLALGPAYTRGERSGELVHTLIDGVETLDEYVAHYLPARLLAVLVPGLVFLLMLWLDPWTTLVLLFAGPVLLLLLAFIGGQVKEITERRFLELSWMSTHFLDMLQGLATLKLFGRSQEQAGNIEEISQHYGKTTLQVLRTAFQTSLVMEWAATAAAALVALEVSLRMMNGGLSFERALAVLLLTPEFFLPLRQMALKYHTGTAGKAAAQRIFSILDTPIPSRQPLPSAIPSQLQAVSERFDICFDDVRFAYEDGQRPALCGFSLTVSQGQTVALVGPSGAGKTTVANMLLRFIAPDSGGISAGGREFSSIERTAWLAQVAWVPQLPHLFYDSLANNIRLGRPEASLDQVIAAAQAAGLHELAQGLPQGYDTLLGEQGVRLSGGQRQRLALARAFLKDAPLLILDEATSHLDAESEALIQQAVARLMRNRTVLVIAHSLKLAASANRIVVMEAGRVAESGSHTELLLHGGLYPRLVETLAGGEAR